MKKFLIISMAAVGLAALISPVMANILVRGQAVKGVYWAEEKGPLGEIYYECYNQKNS